MKWLSKLFLQKRGSSRAPFYSHASATSAISVKVESQGFAISRTRPGWERIMQSRTVRLYLLGELPLPGMGLVGLLEG
jgi:hypothetical protein